MASTLIVPINVAALAVGLPDTQGDGPAGVAQNLAPMADFSRLPYVSGGVHNPGPYVSAVAVENAEPFEGQVPLLQGIHVHWALPDGLTNGTAGSAGLSFPNAPNRWLVTRIVVSTPKGATPTTAVESWVVESDRLSASPTAPAGLQQPNVPLALSAGGQTFRWLGQAFPLATWSEVGGAVKRLAPFTAVGYGEPTFAAFYPNCATVFGYYDNLSDLTGYDPSTSTISYHVAGWYSDPTADPLAQPNATPATYGWSYTASGDAPTSTVCAGVMDGVPWNPATAYLGGTPGALSVAVASSTQEAVSALMAAVLQQDGEGFDNAEQVLNALQFGLLSGSDNEIDSLAQFEEDVHSAGFATYHAGPLWTVVSATGGNDPDQGGEVTLPDAQAEALNALNVLQLQLNDLAFQYQAMQLQLFVDWYKYQVIEHPSTQVPLSQQLPKSLVGQGYQVQQYLRDELNALTGLAGQITSLQGQVTGASGTLATVLPPSLTLTNQIGAPRYYQPSDPVLVLSGPDVTPTERYGNDAAGSSDGTLACRLDSQLVTQAQLAAGVVSGSALATVNATALPALAAQPAQAPAALLQQLVQEAFLVAKYLQPSVLAVLLGQGGAANPAVLDAAGTLKALQGAAAAFLAGTPPLTTVTYTGSAPGPVYYDAWNGTPWLPLLLQYDVQLQPVQYLDPSSGPASYLPSFINGNFAVDPDVIDLQYTGAAPQQIQVYTGSAILTPSATIDLAGEIQRYITSVGGTDPELTDVLNALAGLPVLAQGLAGFTQALLMRGQVLQMPVGDPLTPPPLLSFVASVNTAVGNANETAPLPENSFNPIRAGVFAITKLRLVDVFGRFKDYNSPSVIVAKGLAPPAQLNLPAGQAFLPPRITQPARLLFRWRAADDSDVESTGAPSTSPVLAWVVPNYLDNALALYTAGGMPLGELALSADQQRVLWTPAPGGAFPIDTPLATVVAGQNADLVNFAEALFNGGSASFFLPFFSAVQEALTFSLPAQFRESAAQAVLLGQPLALARASLALDLAGPAATDESWTTFANAVIDDTPPTDGGLSQVQFPVVLGALNRLDDTLVGYWISPSDVTGYQSFYAPYATAGQGGVQPPAQATLTLTPTSSSGGETDVVVLMDPRGSVHATTGILPVKEIDIPPAQYAASLAALAVTFETTPVLSGSNVPAQGGGAPPMVMVQPKVPTGTWSWITTNGTSWAATTLVDAASGQGTLNYTPQTISEGWLKLSGVEGAQ